MMKNNKRKLVYLEWHDAHCNTGWIGEEGLKEWAKGECVIKEVGWIYEETDKQIIMYARHEDLSGEVSYGLLQKIPKTWIRKRIDLTKYINP